MCFRSFLKLPSRRSCNFDPFTLDLISILSAIALGLDRAAPAYTAHGAHSYLSRRTGADAQVPELQSVAEKPYEWTSTSGLDDVESSTGGAEWTLCGSSIPFPSLTFRSNPLLEDDLRDYARPRT